MALIPWKERHPLTQLRDEIDNIFDQFFGRVKKTERQPWESSMLSSPPVDMEETEKDVLVSAEMPGLDPKDFQISITGNTLTIKGEKKEEKEKKEKSYHMLERRYGSFYRSIALPYDVASDKVDARYENGILKIKLPKLEPEKARQIKVNVKSGE